MIVLIVALPENVNQIYPSCIPWPKNLCPAQESISPSSVQQSTTVFSRTASPSPIVAGDSSTMNSAPVSSASVTTSANVFATPNPQQPNQQTSSSPAISSEGIIYSLIGSVIVLALFIVIIAIFLTLQFHKRYQRSKTSLDNDARHRSEKLHLTLNVNLIGFITFDIIKVVAVTAQ